MAEQLGAGGRPSDEAGPDWSQTARSSSAPDWATATPAGESSPAGTSTRTATRTAAPQTAGARHTPAPGADPDWADAPSDDDEDLSTSGAVGQPVIENVLGGTVIAINDDPVA